MISTTATFTGSQRWHTAHAENGVIICLLSRHIAKSDVGGNHLALMSHIIYLKFKYPNEFPFPHTQPPPPTHTHTLCTLFHYHEKYLNFFSCLCIQSSAVDRLFLARFCVFPLLFLLQKFDTYIHFLILYLIVIIIANEKAFVSTRLKQIQKYIFHSILLLHHIVLQLH